MYPGLLRHHSPSKPAELFFLNQEFLQIPRFMMCSGRVDLHIRSLMLRNLESYVWTTADISEPRRNWTFMIDDVNNDGRMRPLLGGTEVTGVPVGGMCRCSNATFAPTHVKSIDDLRTLKQLCDRASCGLMAQEITVCGIGAHHMVQYAPKVVHASGSCKTGEQGEDVVTMIETILDIWYTDPRGYEQRGPLATVWSDTAAPFVRAVHSTLEGDELPSDHWLRQEYLATMPLFDARYAVKGKDRTPVAGGGDSRHVFKRSKEKGKSDAGPGMQTHGPGTVCLGGSKLMKIIGDLVDNNGNRVWPANQVINTPYFGIDISPNLALSIKCSISTRRRLLYVSFIQSIRTTRGKLHTSVSGHSIYHSFCQSISQSN